MWHNSHFGYFGQKNSGRNPYSNGEKQILAAARSVGGQVLALIWAKIDLQGFIRGRSQAVRQISPAASVNEILVRVGDPQVSGRKTLG